MRKKKLFYTWIKKHIVLLMFIFNCQCAIAGSSSQSVQLILQHAELRPTINMLAQLLHLNVILSPHITGDVNLNLERVDAKSAFYALLMAHHLGSWQVGNLCFIAPREELFKRKEEEMKWQALLAQSEPLVTVVLKIHYAKADEIARILQQPMFLTSKRGMIRVDKRSNSLCVRDTIKHIKRIQKLIKTLDTPLQQIVIRARLISIDSDYERALGINFQAMTTQSMPISNQYSLAIAKLAGGTILDIKLAALENSGHAELISNPSLFAANQQTAMIEAGEEVPYQEVSESGGTAVVFKKAVLSLKVTPDVLPANKIILQLQINQDRPSDKMVLGMPTISTRKITTNILVRDRQTIVLGGIYERNAEKMEERIPFLSRLPLLGVLFRQQRRRENKRELLIFVTPKIIK